MQHSFDIVLFYRDNGFSALAVSLVETALYHSMFFKKRKT
jgi:hypothetical protein